MAFYLDQGTVQSAQYQSKVSGKMELMGGNPFSFVFVSTAAELAELTVAVPLSQINAGLHWCSKQCDSLRP